MRTYVKFAEVPYSDTGVGQFYPHITLLKIFPHFVVSVRQRRFKIRVLLLRLVFPTRLMSLIYSTLDEYE